MKKFWIFMVAGSILWSGCSAKNGAIIGGTTGAIAGGILGAGISKQHVGNGNTTQTALQVGVVFGLVGALLGAGVGYTVDALQEEKKMREIRASHHIKGLEE